MPWPWLPWRGSTGHELLSQKKLVGAATTAAFLAILVFLGKPLLSRFLELARMSTSEHGSQNVRLVLWLGALKIWLQHPLFGSGTGTYKIFFPEHRVVEYEKVGVTHNILHAHCESLELLSDMGILGLLSFCAPVILILYQGLKRLKELEDTEKHVLAGVLSGTIGLLAHNQVCVNMRWPTCAYFFWLILGIIWTHQPVWSLTFKRIESVPTFGVCTVLLAFLTWTAYENVVKPWFSEVAYMRGKLLSDRSLWSEATKWLQKAVELYPANKRAHYYLGYCAFEQQRYEEAVQHYRRLQQYSPHYAQVHYNLAAAYLNLNRWEEAAKEYAMQKRLGGLPEGFDFDALLATLASHGLSGKQKYVECLRRIVEGNPGDYFALNRTSFH